MGTKLNLAIGISLVVAAASGYWVFDRNGKPPRKQADVSSLCPVGTTWKVDYAAASKFLESIRVEREDRNSKYDREDWPHWLDRDGDGLDSRIQVLRDESLVPATIAKGKSLKVVSGLWYDPYTDTCFTDPGKLDVDHLVALQEANDSLPKPWNREDKARYANDVSDPTHLIAVEAAANRAKGARGPEDWLPPNPLYVCAYVSNWISVKARWKLSMDERERVFVGNALEDCRSRG